MAKNNQFFEDLGKMAQSTFSTMVNLKNEITSMIQDQLKNTLKSMDLVSKSDLEPLKKAINHLQQEQKDHLKHCHKHECLDKADSKKCSSKPQTTKTKVKVTKNPVK